MDTTSKHAIPYLEGDDLAAEADTVSQAQSERLDEIIAIDSQGALASRPVSTPETPGKAGRYYWATDTLALYRDHGTGWTQVVTLATDGKLILGGDANLYRSAADVLKTDDKLHVVGEVEIDGALNHDGTHVGLRGKTPVAAAGYVTNAFGYGTERDLENAPGVDGLTVIGNALATLIRDLADQGIVSHTFAG